MPHFPFSWLDDEGKYCFEVRKSNSRTGAAETKFIPYGKDKVRYKYVIFGKARETSKIKVWLTNEDPKNGIVSENWKQVMIDGESEIETYVQLRTFLWNCLDFSESA